MPVPGSTRPRTVEHDLPVPTNTAESAAVSTLTAAGLECSLAAGFRGCVPDCTKMEFTSVPAFPEPLQNLGSRAVDPPVVPWNTSRDSTSVPANTGSVPPFWWARPERSLKHERLWALSSWMEALDAPRRSGSSTRPRRRAIGGGQGGNPQRGRGCTGKHELDLRRPGKAHGGCAARLSVPGNTTPGPPGNPPRTRKHETGRGPRCVTTGLRPSLKTRPLPVANEGLAYLETRAEKID
jgi:hypothetical protein